MFVRLRVQIGRVYLMRVSFPRRRNVLFVGRRVRLSPR